MDLKQMAIDHAERAVQNLRRSLNLSAETDHPEINMVRKQQKERLQMWEVTLAALTLPKDEDAESTHIRFIGIVGECAQLRSLVEVLQRQLSIADAQLARFKEVWGEYQKSCVNTEAPPTNEELTALEAPEPEVAK